MPKPHPKPGSTYAQLSAELNGLTARYRQVNVGREALDAITRDTREILGRHFDFADRIRVLVTAEPGSDRVHISFDFD